MEGEDRTTVTLGDEEYTVVAQPYPRVFRQLSEFGEQLQALGTEKDADVASLVSALGTGVHGFVRIFIPDLMAEYRFAGYATQVAFEAGELDEQAEAAAPTFPQIIDAIEVAFAVNGGKRLGELVGKLLGPKLKEAVQEYLADMIRDLRSQGSMNSPSPPDGARPNGSTPASPTPADAQTPPASSIPGPASAGSPSLVSSP